MPSPVQIELPSAPAVRLRVRHENIYQYDQPITRSVHTLHLRPVHDRWQTLVEHQLQIVPGGAPVEYEDAFGNWTTQFELTEPYRELRLVSESVVELLDLDPFAFTKTRVRPTIPVSWMPSERMMLAPYLTPVELPATQLKEILDYAQSFVARNKYDLLETLFDMNLTLFREFAYVPLSTHVETTPFDVLTTKRGVCQDFANLFICMARLLNLPARYVCGYIAPRNAGESRAPPGASHAWVQLYVPGAGWKGFDPTNGVLPATEHVRVAVGRHFRDTAPITGTLYAPANETLQVSVDVTPSE
jgi:transglutaminase-like putative cysteine protease